MKKLPKFESLKWEMLSVQTELYMKQVMDAEEAIEKIPDIGPELRTFLLTLALNPNNCSIIFLDGTNTPIELLTIKNGHCLERVPTINLTRKLSLTDEDYYKEDYKKRVDRRKDDSVDYQRYKEALEGQLLFRNKPRIFNQEDEYLNKEETKEEIVRQMDMYRKVYVLPPYNISPFEWDTFFDVLYSIYEQKRIQDQFADQMCFILRITLSTILIKGFLTITIQDFIDSLSHLVVENGEFTETEINRIQNALKKQLSVSKILEFPPSSPK